jgi:hypothetical protein
MKAKVWALEEGHFLALLKPPHQTQSIHPHMKPMNHSLPSHSGTASKRLRGNNGLRYVAVVTNPRLFLGEMCVLNLQITMKRQYLRWFFFCLPQNLPLSLRSASSFPDFRLDSHQPLITEVCLQYPPIKRTGTHSQCPLLGLSTAPGVIPPLCSTAEGHLNPFSYLLPVLLISDL